MHLTDQHSESCFTLVIKYNSVVSSIFLVELILVIFKKQMNDLFACVRLEPLLQRIHEKRSAVLCPIIDMISDNTLAYWGGPATSVGAFWWSLHFKWMGLQKAEQKRRKSPIEPIRFSFFWRLKRPHCPRPIRKNLVPCYN